MNDKDKCPKCGAEQKTDTVFDCGSYYFTPYGQPPKPSKFFESTQCYRNQLKAAKSLLIEKDAELQAMRERTELDLQEIFRLRAENETFQDFLDAISMRELRESLQEKKEGE